MASSRRIFKKYSLDDLKKLANVDKFPSIRQRNEAYETLRGAITSGAISLENLGKVSLAGLTRNQRASIQCATSQEEDEIVSEDDYI